MEDKGKRQGKYSQRRARPVLLVNPTLSLLSFLPSFLLPRVSPYVDHAAYPRVPEKIQDDLCRLFLPQVPDRWGLWVFPPARLPDRLPHLSGLRGPRPTPRKKVVAGLSSPQNHQHLSLSALLIVSFRYGPIAACPDMSWKHRPVTGFRSRRSCFRLRPLPGGGLYLRSGPT